MKKIILISSLLLACIINTFAQKDPNEAVKPIVEEGKRLYKSEMASWYGTDLFLEAYEDKTNIGGYFSYTEENISKCIFFSRAEEPKVLGCISFDTTFNVEAAKIDLAERRFTKLEQSLYEIRKKALEEIQTDTLFKVYQNTNFNIIPLIHNNTKKVYVLTGPQINGVVIFGNDYLISFNKKNEVTEKKQLHKNIIPIHYGEEEEEGKEVVGAMHVHSEETGDFMTATDICTLMLYSKYANWKTHNVVSKKYLNIWNCETNTLAVIPMDTIKKINKDQEKREKKEKKKEKKKKKN